MRKVPNSEFPILSTVDSNINKKGQGMESQNKEYQQKKWGSVLSLFI